MAGRRSDQESRGNRVVVLLAGFAIIGIALYQTGNHGAPDKYTVGALLALALGGGAGKIADAVLAAYLGKNRRDDKE